MSLKRRIAQNIIGELMQNEWQRLHLFDSEGNEYRYYDAQGIEIAPGDSPLDNAFQHGAPP